jgi:hypothetical protein
MTFRQSARGRLTDAQLDALVRELDAEKGRLENVVREHETREKEIKRLEDKCDKTVTLIQAGKWYELGITAPEARRERYREVGLEARAYPDGAIAISWYMGTKEVGLTADPSTNAHAQSHRLSPR